MYRALFAVVIVGLIVAETSLAGRHAMDETNNPQAEPAFAEEAPARTRPS